jgi:hypothetical protein
MPTTSCELSGNVYQMDYTKMPSKRGTYYFGKIHTSPVTSFSFTILTSGSHEFDDSREPYDKQQAIVNAIKGHEIKIAV